MILNEIALWCQDRFGMKLQAVHRRLAVADSHDFAVLRPCQNLQAFGKVRRIDS